MPKTHQRILLGISGGIAAYKSLELIRLLKKAGHDVRVCLTPTATHFVTPLSCQALSGHPVYQSNTDTLHPDAMDHIALAKWADLLLIAPASANTMAQLAHGMADDLLSTLALAFQGRLVMAPAMNQAMYQHPATQTNLQTLISRGVECLGPAHGEQACGDIGPGRMLEPADIVDQLFMPSQQPLKGESLLITVGPTHEPMDPVRFIGNRSSGQMGFAMAMEAKRLGAAVTVIAGPTSYPTPSGMHCIHVQTADEMHQSVMQHINAATLFIGAAAVADYRPKQIASQKIKKNTDECSITLIKNPDILSAVSQFTHLKLVVGFAAETENIIENAMHKCKRKNCDMVFANPVGPQQGFDQSENAVTVVGPDKILANFPQQEKDTLAKSLWQLICETKLEPVA